MAIQHDWIVVCLPALILPLACLLLATLALPLASPFLAPLTLRIASLSSPLLPSVTLSVPSRMSPLFPHPLSRLCIICVVGFPHLWQAEVQSTHQDGSIVLHTRSEKYGKVGRVHPRAATAARRTGQEHPLPCVFSCLSPHRGLLAPHTSRSPYRGCSYTTLRPFSNACSCSLFLLALAFRLHRIA